MDGFLEKLEQFKLPIMLCVLGVVLILGGIFASGLNKTQKREFPKESLVDSRKTISVDIAGAVNNPGVYQLKEGSRIEEAISTAGGFAESANREYISKYLNLAQKLSDGSKIYVPFAGDPAPVGAVQGVVAGTQVQSQVNINTATQAELEALPGIGSVTASKIISDRPYQKIEDLLDKKIVSKSTFEKIKDSIVVY